MSAYFAMEIFRIEFTQNEIKCLIYFKLFIFFFFYSKNFINKYIM